MKAAGREATGSPSIKSDVRQSGLVQLGMSRISDIDFSNIKKKLNIYKELPCSCCDITTEYIERRYREFLSLQFAYPDTPIVPTKSIDMFWHHHILDTRAYQRDCEHIFGEFLHHYPYFGLNGEEDAQNLERAFEKTCELWEIHFGLRPDQGLGAKSRCSRCSSCSRR